MADEGLTIVDGEKLRFADLSLPESDVTFTGAQLLDVADSKVSSLLGGLSLPDTVKSSALKRLNVGDVINFRCAELDREEASSKFREYVIAIADELQDDPIVASILDGNTLRLFLEDEDDFAMLAENLFTELDIEDTGKISKSEIRNALLHMGVEMGIPPFSEFPLLNDILKKHGAEGDEVLGQAQFAELLQPVLQELAEALAEKHVVVIQDIKFSDGSKLRKLLGDKQQLNNVIEQILLEKYRAKDGPGNTKLIRDFLEKHGKVLGLPPPEAHEAVYNEVFLAVDDKKNNEELEKDEFGALVEDILEKFADELEANPVLDN